MIQKVIHRQYSPLNAKQSVLKLSCGHFSSFGIGPTPDTVDCVNCDSPPVGHFYFDGWKKNDTSTDRMEVPDHARWK